MLIGFDASRAFVAKATGTENYSLNLLKALARIDRKNQYRVYLRESQSGKSKLKVKGDSLHTSDFDFELPNNFELKIIRPYRFWTQIGLALETWRNPVDVLFIPAHTLPILRRRKIGSWLGGYGNEARIEKRKAVTFGHDKRLTLNETGIVTDKRSTKYVVTIHDLGVEYLPLYHQFPQRYYLDLASKYAACHADALIAISAATKRDLIDRYKVDSKKVSIVPEGVDTSFFRPRSKKEIEISNLKFKIKGPYILFVGTIQPRKNLEMLIQAFGLLVHSSRFTVHRIEQHPRGVLKPSSIAHPRGENELNLVIAGKLGWDYQEILNAPKKYGVENRVKFLGYVSSVDLPALYTGGCVLAAPSLFEGFDLPILEALACGCPVVASDIGPHREIFSKISRKFEIRNSKFEIASSKKLDVPMILVKPKDIKEWSQILYQSISQYDKRQSIITKKRELALKFSWDEAAKKTLEVFESCLS